jgi:hypothetical protein
MVDSLSHSEAIERLRREKEELAEVNARLASEKLELERENARLKEGAGQMEELLGRIDELDRTAARQAAPFWRREALNVAEKKRPGRLPGHRGAQRERPPHVDHVVEQPLLACLHCGGAVHDRAPITQYIEELPPVRPVVTADDVEGDLPAVRRSAQHASAASFAGSNLKPRPHTVANEGERRPKPRL